MPGKPSAAITEVFATYPKNARNRLLKLRELIMQTAAANPQVGALTETLKWSEAAYLTEQTKSGTTIRIAWKPAKPDQYAMYVHCQTNLVDTFRTRFPELEYEGNRAVVFDVHTELDKDAVAACIEMALTYHSNKRVAQKRDSSKTAGARKP